ncbi:MAG: hypothetical protein KDE27_22620 [Planctomycetes bacterium]|nr:hypothetical protein [Planctomycetota bacterium]
MRSAFFISCLSLVAACATSPPSSPRVTEVYSVRDIVFEPREAAGFDIADLANGIRQATGSDNWEEGSILTEDSGYLSVSATPAMHDKVQMVLADVRRFAAKGR